ncbi:MAG: hypothetical protein WA277_03955 [Nitrospirota bacterium]
MISIENKVERSPQIRRNKTGKSMADLLILRFFFKIISRSHKKAGIKIAKSLRVIVWAKGRIKISIIKEN